MTTYGPYYRSVSLPGVGFSKRTWYRQKPISDAPLPYKFDHSYVLSGTVDPLTWATSAYDPASPDWINTTNRAYSKLTSQIGSASAVWGANLATWKQSHGMIVARATQLLQAVRALKRLDFGQAAKTLGIRKPKKKHASDLAGQWLELSYGWIPLIQDIHNSVDVMQQPLPRVLLRAKASGKSGPWPLNSYDTGTWKFHVNAGARLVGVHPGALLANRLGLVNPATVAWEVIPFSFVIDWFVPVGTFLQSFTDFVGVDLDRKFTSCYGIHDIVTQVAGRPIGAKRRVQMVRTLTLPTYRPRPRFTGFYSMRGANAIALLIGGLKSLKS